MKQGLPEGNPALYLELGQTLSKTGRTDEAIGYLRKGIEIDPFNQAMQKTLILQYINLKSYREATTLMEQYVDAFPDDSFMRSLLARVKQ